MTAGTKSLTSFVTSNTVDVTRKRIRSGPAPLTIKRRALKILNYLHCKECELSVVLCDDTFIRQLNREFREKDTPTDVLSFPLNENRLKAPREIQLGDIVISVETAKRQSDEFGGGLLTEVTSLLVHGVLHVLGYTHESKPKDAEMNSIAMEVLRLF